MKPTQVVGRVLTCTACGSHVDVLEAASGATTDAEHRWIGDAPYTCGECLCGVTQATVTATAPDTALVAA